MDLQTAATDWQAGWAGKSTGRLGRPNIPISGTARKTKIKHCLVSSTKTKNVSDPVIKNPLLMLHE
jgi:hypothetical protein